MHHKVLISYQEKLIFLHIVFFLCILVTIPAYADEKVIEIQVKNNITATATYSKGDQSKPVILLLHGFLTTRDNATLKNLNNAIKDEGYSTLAPTLSLDIDHRKQALACEAIHTHTMQTDIKEIHYWTKWLINQGHQQIILLGHSFGSLNMLVFLQQHALPEIKYAIATSLIDIEHAIGKQSVTSQLEQARQIVSAPEKNLHEYKISYCNKFVSTAETFISYAEWDKTKILNLLQTMKTPVHIVMGGNDQRMEANWPSLLGSYAKKVSIINGANHFFSNEYEFELHDKVLEILKRI